MPCIEWEGSRDRHGYGRIGPRLAHRVRYEEEHGPIAPGLVVMHTCDNPPCVNLAHLRLGTQGDNLRDMASKGRHVGTTRVPRATVEKIRNAKGSQRAIAARFGVSQGYVSRVRSGARRCR